MIAGAAQPGFEGCDEVRPVIRPLPATGRRQCVKSHLLQRAAIVEAPAQRIGERAGIGGGDNDAVIRSDEVAGAGLVGVMTGRPCAIASATTMPKPSDSVGNTSTSACSKAAKRAGRGTAPWNTTPCGRARSSMRAGKPWRP